MDYRKIIAAFFGIGAIVAGVLVLTPEEEVSLEDKMRIRSMFYVYTQINSAVDSKVRFAYKQGEEAIDSDVSMTSDQKERIIAAADAWKYRKPKNANGSRGRHFAAYLRRTLERG